MYVRLRHCTVHAVGLRDIHPAGRPVAEHGDRYPQERQTIDGKEKKVCHLLIHEQQMAVQGCLLIVLREMVVLVPEPAVD